LKLRIKTLVYTGLTLLFIVVMTSVFSSMAIRSGLTKVEDDMMMKNAKRLKESFKFEQEKLQTTVNDWSHWDETYKFADDKDPAYATTNLDDQAVANLGVSAMVFIDTSGKIAYGLSFSDEKKAKEPLSDAVREAVESNRELFNPGNEKDFSLSGIMLTKDFPLIFSASSILNSKQEGPSRGVLLLAKNIDQAFIASLSKRMQLDFNLKRVDGKLEPAMAEAARKLAKTDFPEIYTGEKNMISVFVPISGADGKHAMIAKISVKRDIYNEGKAMISTLICSLIVSAGILYLMIVLILEKSVLLKVRNFTEVFSGVRKMSDLSLRVDETGTDEISILGKEINSMLTALEQSRTSQQYTEISMLNNEKRYQLIIDQAPIGIITCHLDGRFRTVNKSFCEITGYAADELLAGKKLMDISDPEGYTSEQKIIEEITRKNLPPSEFEKKFIRKDGRPVEVVIRMQVYRDLLGEPQYLVKTVLDVTEHRKNQATQKKLEEALRQAQQLESIGRLAGGFAHDLNNFLVPILAYADMLLSVTRKDDPLYNGVLEIKSAAERAKTLSQKFLALSSKQMLEVSTISLNEVIEGFKNILQRLIREDIRIEYKLSPDISLINGDYAQLEQVIMNLTVNAKDAMPHGGRLTFETYNEMLAHELPDSHPAVKPGRYAVLKVTDNGTGISKQALAHLFEAFYTTKERGKGTGLGLSMVHGIVNQHGGGIKVWTAEGKGTSFMIYLPALESGAAAISPSTQDMLPDEIKPAAGETVLIVEDEPSVLRIVSSELKRNGFNVLEAESGPLALDIARGRKENIDILLTDVIMPEMDGKKLYNLICEIKPDIKVIYMSGHTYDILSQHDIQAPDAQFISKPFSMDLLRKKISHLLQV